MRWYSQYRFNMCIIALAGFVLCQPVFAAEKAGQPTDVQIQNILNSHLESVTRLARSPDLQKLMEQLYSKAQSIDNIRKVSASWNTDSSNSTKDNILNGEIGKFVSVRVEKSANVYSRGYVLDRNGVVVGANPLPSKYWKIGDKIFVDAYGSADGKGVVSSRVRDNVTEQDVYWIAVPVKKNPRTTLGVLVMGIKADHVVVHAKEDGMLKDGEKAANHDHH